MDVTLVSLSGVTGPPGGAVREAEHSCRPGGAEHGHVRGLPARGECPPRRPRVPQVRVQRAPARMCFCYRKYLIAALGRPGVLVLIYTNIPSPFVFEMKCVEIIAPHIIF